MGKEEKIANSFFMAESSDKQWLKTAATLRAVDICWSGISKTLLIYFFV